MILHSQRGQICPLAQRIGRRIICVYQEHSTCARTNIVTRLQQIISGRTHGQQEGNVTAASPAPETLGRAYGFQIISRCTLMAARKGICKMKGIKIRVSIFLFLLKRRLTHPHVSITAWLIDAPIHIEIRMSTTFQLALDKSICVYDIHKVGIAGIQLVV